MITTLYLLVALTGDIKGEVIKVYETKDKCEWVAIDVNRFLKETGKVACKSVDVFGPEVPLQY